MKIKNSPIEIIKEIKPENLRTIAKAAKHFGVERATIYNRVKRGEIVQVRYLDEDWVDITSYKKPSKKETTDNS